MSNLGCWEPYDQTAKILWDIQSHKIDSWLYQKLQSADIWEIKFEKPRLMCYSQLKKNLNQLLVVSFL